jgi:hypothetical protein
VVDVVLLQGFSQNPGAKRGVLGGDLWSLCGVLRGWKCAYFGDGKKCHVLRFIF